MSDPNGLLYMQARHYNPYLCRFISADPSGFSGGLNLYAYADGNPVSYADPFGLGALSESGIAAASLYNAPTPEQVQIQDELTAFADIATLGLANIASEAITGNDLWGSQVTPEEQNAAAINLAATAVTLLIPGAELEGGGEDLVTQATGDLSRNAEGGTQGRWVAQLEQQQQTGPAAAPMAYSVAFETQLTQTELGLSRAEHFQIGNTALEAEREANPALARLVPAPQGWGRPPAEWTWQHATIDQGSGRTGVLQLVPRSQHTAGSPFWPLFHPLPGGGGGYSQWAIPAGAPPN